jgi:hypothetical protein
MRIFNIILNGDDAKEFCKQNTEFKISWIKTHTNQKDMELIMEFINNPPKNNDCGCGCGEKKIQKQEKIPTAFEAPISLYDEKVNKIDVEAEEEKPETFSKRPRFRRE